MKVESRFSRNRSPRGIATLFGRTSHDQRHVHDTQDVSGLAIRDRRADVIKQGAPTIRSDVAPRLGTSSPGGGLYGRPAQWPQFRRRSARPRRDAPAASCRSPPGTGSGAGPRTGSVAAERDAERARGATVCNAAPAERWPPEPSDLEVWKSLSSNTKAISGWPFQGLDRNIGTWSFPSFSRTRTSPNSCKRVVGR